MWAIPGDPSIRVYFAFPKITQALRAQSGVTKHCHWAVSENLWKSNKEHKYYQVSAADHWSVSSTVESRQSEALCQLRIPITHLVVSDVRLANDRALQFLGFRNIATNPSQNWLTDFPKTNFWLVRWERNCSLNLIWVTGKQLNNCRSVIHLCLIEVLSLDNHFLPPGFRPKILKADHHSQYFVGFPQMAFALSTIQRNAYYTRITIRERPNFLIVTASRLCAKNYHM